METQVRGLRKAGTLGIGRYSPSETPVRCGLLILVWFVNDKGCLNGVGRRNYQADRHVDVVILWSRLCTHALAATQIQMVPWKEAL